MRPTILIVDDEQMLLELFREALSVHYEVLVAKTIGHAVDLLQTHVVDAVITDLNCGNDSGLDLLRWIKAHMPALLSSTFILSASSQPEPTYRGDPGRIAGHDVGAGVFLAGHPGSRSHAAGRGS